MKKKFATKLTNTIAPAAPTSVWGYKGIPGKGGRTNNSVIINANKKEND